MTSQKRPVVMWLDFKQGVESEHVTTGLDN